MLWFKSIQLFSGFYSKEALPENSSFSKGSKSVSKDRNIIQSMGRAFSNIHATQYFFRRTLETCYLLPAQKYLATKRYNNSTFGRILPYVYNRMGFNFSNAFDWIELFLAIFISPIFILILFVIVILYLYLW